MEPTVDRSSMNRSPLVVFGAGGHGKVVVDAAQAAGIHIDLVVDDHPASPQLLGVQLVSSRDPYWLGLKQFRFVVAVGDNLTRARLFAALQDRGGRPLNVVHPRSVLAPSVRLGLGVMICAGVVVNVDARIGDNCIVNTSASVDHDCVVEDHVHLCPGVRLAGMVRIGQGSMLGTGAVVLPGVSVGSECVIGAGAVVNRDLPDRVMAYGVPCRIQKHFQE